MPRAAPSLDLVTVPAAAKHFGLDVRTLRAAINAGRLPAYTLDTRWVRVDLDEVAQWIRSTRVDSQMGSVVRPG